MRCAASLVLPVCVVVVICSVRSLCVLSVLMFSLRQAVVLLVLVIVEWAVPAVPAWVTRCDDVRVRRMHELASNSQRAQ